MTHPRLQCGFTLIEVLVAMFVLTVLSTGLLATTWRLVGFARDEVEHMVADNYCHDVMWAVYRQKYDQIPAGGIEDPKDTWKLSWEIDPGEIDPEKVPDRLDMPRIVSIDFFGRKDVGFPLWRTKDKSLLPKCNVIVKEKIESVFLDDNKIQVTNKEIRVEVEWCNGKDRNRDKKSHSIVLTRSPVDIAEQEEKQ